MSEFFIVDAHFHIGLPGVFFVPQVEPTQQISLMDKLNIRYAVCSDILSITEDANIGIVNLRELFEQSKGRIYYLGVFNPNCSEVCLDALKQEIGQPGFVGLKIHPSFHGKSADSDVYELAWKFAADNNLTIMTHSWSVSGYNPVQKLSTPLLFEKFIKCFPEVTFVLGHSGGRGQGRNEAIHLVNNYPNVYMDISGDVFCYQLVENLVNAVGAEKILFGSDTPWIDPRAVLSRVLLADIDDADKEKILKNNAVKVYKLKI